MSIQVPYGLAGVQDTRSSIFRRVVKGGMFTMLPGGGLLSGSASRDPSNTPDVAHLRAGLLMGRITSGGKFAPAIIGVLAGAEAIGQTTLNVSAAVATEMSRRFGGSGTFKLTGPPTAGGVVATETVTYSAINTSTGDITCTAIVNAYVAGSFIRPTDGSEAIMTILPDGYPRKVTDIDGNSVDTEFPDVPVSGIVDSAQLLPVWPSDTSLRLWLKNQLNGAGLFIFDDPFSD